MSRDHEVAEGALLWEPSEEAVARARVTGFARWLAERGVPAGSYDELWRWSVTEIDAFWDAIWSYFEVVGERGGGPVREGGPTPVDGLTWFPGATVNYAANALRRAAADPDRPAVVFRSEAGGHRVLTGRELCLHVAEVRAGLAALGVGKGDRVVAYVPSIPEALICFLATASLGAIWSSCSPDFGSSSVIDRFCQIEPKVMIAVDGYAYNGKRFDRREIVGEIEAALPTLAATVLIPYLDPAATPDGLRVGVRYADLPASGHDTLEFEDVPFDHPLWVVYSSGTTGLPKPIVHGHGGVVLEHLKALSFHQDLGPDDVFFWYTTTGWMMWNYLVGGLLVGSTIVLYDGAPADLWKLAAETGVTYMGVGAPYITACAKDGQRPGEEYDLSGLRGIGSTGSPLPPEGFAWVYEAVGKDLLLGSFAGGTDLCTGFVGPTPLLPLYAGVLQCRGLGAKVESFGDDGRPVIDEVGELVITEPMPSMPVFFWNDPDGERYRESYFEMYPGVWRHGDWIKVRPDGGCVIYGRSDSTLNRGGVRMGTADFYRVVEAFPEIADSLVIDTGRLGQEGRLILYVQPAEGAELTEELVGELRRRIRSALSPRHVPDEINEVPGIPRTLSGKKLEVPVRKILQGTPVERAANRDSLADPDVLDHFIPSS
ncbi:acetoacetate--CoA ligase [Actinomadura viridis]|uniref:Acetoacetyl-CoA synthetase n=1 Tax=Actinomadura viridis TaxID=58110 RepID=A0A931GGV8_9ACTN|nr:acetoacetate--CoA ligase [Actinomadura viridis]MBG6086748.1 acetoacetyl-CoA synthetase [Actinomadura viridis]